MSATNETIRRLTVNDIAKLYADGERIAMLTAYDYPTAKLLDEAGIPMLLVGDSLGRVILGYENEIPVSMADMLHHTGAVDAWRAARPRHRRHAVPVLRHARGRGRQRRPLPRRGRGAGGQARRRRSQRPGDGGGGPCRDPGHGPHRLDAAGRQRRGQGPRPGQEPRSGPSAAARTPWPSRRQGHSRSSSSWSPNSWPRPSPSGCGSRRSGSGRAPAAAARSRS